MMSLALTRKHCDRKCSLDAFGPIPDQSVVIGDFRASRDQLCGKDAHMQLASHQPLLGGAVGLA